MKHHANLFNWRNLPQFFAVLVLLGALNPQNPYPYYMLLRVVVCAVFVHAAYCASGQDRTGWIWVALFMALLYNPFVTVHLTRAIWSVVNIATIGVIVASMNALALPEPGKDAAHTE